MRLNRRQFLLLAGLSSVAAVSCDRTQSNPIEPSNRQEPYSANAITPPTGQPLLRFVALGDAGTGSDHQYAVAEAMTRYQQQHPYNLAVLVGDNIYDNGEIEKIGSVFERPYAKLLQQGVQFRAALGNHDVRTANGELQVRYSAFNMASRYYTYQQGPAQFFVLDTTADAPWKEQLAWLEQSLQRSAAPWKIVYGHHPIYSSGQYGSDAALIKLLTPLFQRHQVQLYINGHEHDYERTQRIAGTTYLTCGIGGATLRPVGRSRWTACAESRHGFVVLDMHRDRTVIQAIDTQGQIFDSGIVPLQA